MKYLNVSMQPFTDKPIYFCGEPLSVDYILLKAIQADSLTLCPKLRKEMLQLILQSSAMLHINLFVQKINLLTYEAIRAFIEFSCMAKENHFSSNRRLMIWVADENQRDFHVHAFYQQ